MTAQRRDNHSTEFGLWLREQKEIESEKGYIATNIDYVWKNYKTGDWMMIEEKRYGRQPKYPQPGLFELVDKYARNDTKYHGFHYVIFENTSPDDGKIFLDKKEISKEQLLKFLQFRSF
jgi:hypothetical protein